MPVSADVYTLAKPVQIQTPADWEAAQAEKQAVALQREDQAAARADLAEQRKLRIEQARQQSIGQSVLSRYGDDSEGALTELRRVAPAFASTYEKQLQERRKSSLDMLKSENDVQKFRTEQGLTMLGLARSTRNAAAYKAAIHNLAADDEDKQVFASIPLGEDGLPDDATLAKMLDMGVSQKDQQARHDEALKHFTSGDIQKGLASALLGAGADPEAWNEALQAGQQFGAGKALIQSFAQPTPENIARAEAIVGREKKGEKAADFTLSPGQTRFDASGKPIASVAKPAGGGGAAKGRNVTSGDANRMADINMGLSEVKSLADEISTPGATGAASWLEAHTPNVVTSLTGIGTAAKQRQAVIDRVKQIIGKSLEGGVLRKEDEAKYAKILPTIGDAPDVVKTKLSGLQDALDRKRDEQLSALEDAGYDTSKFRARADKPAAAAAKSEPAKAPKDEGVSVVAPNGKTYTFPNQGQADAFKNRAGIK